MGLKFLKDYKPLAEIQDYWEIIDRLQLGFETEWLPDYMADSWWFHNVPLAFWIMKTLRPGVFAELGTDGGLSYMAFCQAVNRLGLPTKCFAVDLWMTRLKTGKSVSYYPLAKKHYDRVTSYNDEHYRSFSTILRLPFDAAASRFEDRGIDLLHIDGTHTYDAVRHDFETWRGKMSERGIILFHDINDTWDELDFGAWRFWQEISQEYPSFTFSVGPGLGILGVGNAIPDPLKFMLSADEETARKITTIFGYRGMNLMYMYNSDYFMKVVRSSLSWKITIPLRMFQRFLSKVAVYLS
jgi:hypothetical protein